MASAWIYQDDHQVKKVGAENASYYVGWFNPEGKKRCKSCGKGEAGKRLAEKVRRKVEAELMTGTYREQVQTTWESFRKDYDEKVLAGLAPKTRSQYNTSLDHFERIVKPTRVFYLGTSHVADFVAARRKEPGQKRGALVSPETINHDLRHLKAALAVAKEWGHLATLPKVRMEKTVKHLPTYVNGDHFALIYGACHKARMPEGQPYPAADWWRALLVMGYMTGWRISDMLGLKRADLDADGGVRHHARGGQQGEARRTGEAAPRGP